MGGRREAAPPVSLEALRQKVLLTGHNAGRELAGFLTRLAPHTHVHTDLWLPVLHAILKPHRKPDHLDMTLVELEPFLRAAAKRPRKAKEGDDCDEDQQQDIEELIQMCEIGNEFDVLISSVYKQLTHAHQEQLRKFCLSLEPVGRGLDLSPLREYENKIIRWDAQIEARLAAAGRAAAEVTSRRRPLASYIEHYAEVVRLMADVAEQLSKACVPMRRWVSADAAFSGKVRLAIHELSHRRFLTGEQLKAMELEHAQLTLKLRRAAWRKSGLGEQLNATRRHRLHLRVAEQRLSTQDQRLHARATRVEAAAARISTWPPPPAPPVRGGTTSGSRELLAAQLEAARTDVRKLEEDRTRVRTQLAGVRRENVDVQRRLERAVDEFKSLNDHQEATLVGLEQLERMIRMRREELQQMDEQLVALKRVREVKDRADTVRRIHRHGFLPSDVTENTDPLQEAIIIAATDLGSDWPALYARISFRPPRPEPQRRRDIVEIEESNQHLFDYSCRKRAERGLHLWRRLSQSASLLDLTTALRSMRKQGTITKIEKSLLTTQ